MQLSGVALDSANSRALVTDILGMNGPQLLAVDLSTGVRTILSDNAAMGPGGDINLFFNLVDVALDSTNPGRALVLEDPGRVFSRRSHNRESHDPVRQ